MKTLLVRKKCMQPNIMILRSKGHHKKFITDLDSLTQSVTVSKIELGDCALLCSKQNIPEQRVMLVMLVSAVEHLLAAAAWARYSWGRGWRCRGTSRPSTSQPWTGRSAKSTSSTSAHRDTCSESSAETHKPINPPDRLHLSLGTAVSGLQTQVGLSEN